MGWELEDADQVIYLELVQSILIQDTVVLDAAKLDIVDGEHNPVDHKRQCHDAPNSKHNFAEQYWVCFAES